MTNEQIIYNASIAAGIFTEAEATAIIQTGRRLPIHTYQEWKRLGYQVKRGEKAALTVGLWRFGKNKVENGEEVEEIGEKAFRTAGHLFTFAQVEKAAPVKVKTREEIAAYNAMLAAQRKARKAC